MKIKNLKKPLTKVVQTEFGTDGYIRLDEIIISLDDLDDKYITIKGAYGRMTDGKVDFQEEFELFYPDGIYNADNVAGMLYQKIIDDRADGK